jgi:hypothetical protein
LFPGFIVRCLGVDSADAEFAYAGKPPLWVYAEMAKPLVPLMGQEGYHMMVGVHCMECFVLTVAAE